MADRIELTGLKARGYHGVFPEENRDGQDFLVDLICWLDATRAVETDDVADTINYADLAEIAHQVITGPPYNLIEKVAGTIANIIMARYEQLYAVEVSINPKPRSRGILRMWQWWPAGPGGAYDSGRVIHWVEHGRPLRTARNRIRGVPG